jgi:hypothetical protein
LDGVPDVQRNTNIAADRLEPVPPGVVGINVGIPDPKFADPGCQSLARLLLLRVTVAAAPTSRRIIEERLSLHRGDIDGEALFNQM